MTSLAAWLTDQATELARPIAHRLADDIASRIRIDITVRISLEEP